MSLGPLTSEIIGDFGRLKDLLADWWQLWRQCKTATPFQSPAWLLSWWRAFAPGELCVVAVRRCGRLVGLAPCYIEIGALGPRVLPLGVSLSDYLDVLIDPDTPAGVGSALVAQLAAGMEWDSCEFVELKPQAHGLGLPCPPGCCDQLEIAESCPVLPLPNTPQQLAHVIPAGKRRDVRQSQNRMARRGDMSIVHPPAASIEPVLTDLVRLHQARWDSRAGGVFTDQRVIGFHYAAVADLFASGLLRLYVLKSSSVVAGVYYGFMHADCAYAYLGGFDPAFAFESPGTILLDHAIAEAVREGAREFHFLRGREAYKYQWGATDRWNYRRIFRRTHAPWC
jgi:CelD/BcsL family acetyltransferase involved in cellulose biosynthesis